MLYKALQTVLQFHVQKTTLLYKALHLEIQLRILILNMTKSDTPKKPTITTWKEKKVIIAILSNVCLGLLIPAFALWIGDRNWMSEISASIFVTNSKY